MYISLLAPLLLLATSATALSFNPFPWVRRASPQMEVFACYNTNFTGTCRDIFADMGKCKTLDAADQNQFTSVNVAKEGYYCYFYELDKCSGGSIEINRPGVGNLRGKRFDNRIRSFNCWKK